MSLYAQIPPHTGRSPAAVWQWAADFDQLAAGADDGGGQRDLPEYRTLAAVLRVSALVDVLVLDGVPVMEEGWVLTPHPLRLVQDGADARAGRCPGAVLFPPDCGFAEAVEAFYRALGRAVRGCRPGPGASPSAQGPCAPCARWADHYLAVRVAVL
ncbi:hypothetical protein [Streptomyces yaizuensis]|uniref:Uncharacterized protein n=1 Tax=Streptomyces yaizuensis TaxID=2989713 RepID=A0ABQ5P6K2_9ACTN|nr:hypothetical protein [Streptomyces sp. YSPA8]GLF98205.1 hypothetical protein SYYSPA8_27930 [Streptomyces sp. YSPA8]